eukprot:7584513-Prorocentrum_lima.AAC.1
MYTMVGNRTRMGTPLRPLRPDSNVPRDSCARPHHCRQVMCDGRLYSRVTSGLRRQEGRRESE